MTSSDSDRKQWTRISALFDELIDLPPSTRSHRLGQVAVYAPEIASRVASLLKASEDDEFLARPSISHGGRLAESALGEEELREGLNAKTRLLGRFELGMELPPPGIRFLARDLANGGKVVTVRFWTTLEPGFESQARLLGDFRHPNICPMLGWGKASGGQPFIVMEQPVGAPIHSGFEPDRLSAWLGQILQSLVALHGQGLVHGGVSPETVFVALDQPAMLACPCPCGPKTPQSDQQAVGRMILAFSQPPPRLRKTLTRAVQGGFPSMAEFAREFEVQISLRNITPGWVIAALALLLAALVSLLVSPIAAPR